MYYDLHSQHQQHNLAQPVYIHWMDMLPHTVHDHMPDCMQHMIT